MATDLCLLITRPPSAGFVSQEAFDLAVTGGVFDRQTEVIFTGSGLLHLAEHRPSEGHKSLLKLWQSAGMFGIQRFLVPQAEADTLRSLKPSVLRDSIRLMTWPELHELMQDSRKVMVL
ncbi:MAG: DsrE family protein [Natronospirillum sp.]|uniref:DsrE family protein n=1 Tax=Natronospirillum sp. TaxID=2812955 RepID=UPI00260105BE|nr:DsrE family protein [Natronospirillum sp.]MCH8552391.1 DsrE family protein [Natronospirillum sp.]